MAKIIMPPKEVFIKELDPDIIKPTTANYVNNDKSKGSKIVILGKPGTGKSTLIKSLAYAKKHIFAVGRAFSATERENKFFSSFMTEATINSELNMDELEEAMKRQKLATEHLENPWALVVVDDCTDDPKLLNKPLFQGIFKLGRHWQQMFILSLQYCMDIKPNIRAAIDGTFILREPSIKVRKSIYENFASIIPTFSDFCTIMDVITDDFTALYIENLTQSNDWQECVYYWKPIPAPDGWKMGCESYWDHNDQRYDTSFVPDLF